MTNGRSAPAWPPPGGPVRGSARALQARNRRPEPVATPAGRQPFAAKSGHGGAAVADFPPAEEGNGRDAGKLAGKMRVATAEQMREIDRRAVAEFGMPSLLLMENAGRAVAERACDYLARDQPDMLPGTLPGHRYRGLVVVLCGKGNNGGDGFAAARHLHSRGVQVECFLVGPKSEVRGDARTNLRLLERLGVPVHPALSLRPEQIDRADLIIDALLGTGARGAPSGPVATALQAMWLAAVPVLSVDLPTGFDADTGPVDGSLFAFATEVVTFGALKPGLLPPHLPAAVSLTVADIGLPRPLLERDELPWWLTAEAVRGSWLFRPAAAHKGDAGRVLVVAGSPGLTGGATLCCEGALRAGAGLVTLAIPRSLNPILEAKLTEAMTLPVPETGAGAHCPEALPALAPWLDVAGSVLAIGPGLGRAPETGDLVRALLARPGAWNAVVDADALNLLAPAAPACFPRRGDGEPRCVITPHPGEMARLLGTTVEAVQSNRLETARRAAVEWGCVVVLKGPATVVASPDGRAAVNSSGGPALATGGTGDVLTGMIAALLVQLPPYEAACAAVFVHGVAGVIAEERHGAPGAIAGDVVAALPEALRRLRAGEIPPPCRTI
jgi:hydroxyethylthiazole kinase-like uncharacterized protein yjeF